MTLSEKIVDAVLCNLKQRSGFDHLLEEIEADEETNIEMRDDLAADVRKTLNDGIDR